MASEQTAAALAVRAVRALFALDAVVTAQELLRVTAEGRPRATATVLALHAALIFRGRFSSTQELAIASFELLDREGRRRGGASAPLRGPRTHARRWRTGLRAPLPGKRTLAPLRGTGTSASHHTP